MESLENRTLGKYEIVQEIGRGNMGAVYLGHDAFADRQVAIKVAHPNVIEDEQYRQTLRKLFFNEAKAAGLLKHPNIVSVFDAGVEGDIWYMAMEYVPGGSTVHDYCRPQKLLPIEDILQIAVKCSVALDFAHRKGIVHRDIKPKNLLLTEDRDVKIGDFGIALITRSDVADTQVQGYVGSPLYMSPEQLQGEDITNRTDFFSLGLVLYQLLTGRHPFMADSLAAITHRITMERHRPVCDLRAGTPHALERILDRMLRKHAAQRYRMGLDVAGDLDLVFDQIDLSAIEMSHDDKFDLLKDLAFFSGFQESEVWELVNAGVWEDFRPGETIILEGDDDQSFYVLVSGKASVVKNGKVLDVLSKGTTFGEMSYITGAKRTASVVAREHVTVLKIRPALVGKTSQSCQLRFQQVFLTTLAARLSRVSEQLARECARANCGRQPAEC